MNWYESRATGNASANTTWNRNGVAATAGQVPGAGDTSNL